MKKAIALLSGGLDSILAVLTILRQGIEVKALAFLTPFNCDIRGKYLHVSNTASFAEMFGFDVKLCTLNHEFIEILKKPEFGYGKNMNPCIDCRILMLKEARKFMNTLGADFIITGEVLGQRPMSQRKEIFNIIDRKAGVMDYVLRPLSAKLLNITHPEAKGLISREALYDFSGRSRKPQIALAKELGLTDYPAPAGGCLLTEPNFAYRIKDLLTYNPVLDIRDISLLKIGRHFRFSPSCKIIVGRNMAENEIIESLSGDRDYLLKVEGYGSPITLIVGDITEEALGVAASLCVRYSDAKAFTEVVVEARNLRNTFALKASPAKDELVEGLRIERVHPKNPVKA
jgi:tRNA-specific 2-thiouridylase